MILLTEKQAQEIKGLEYETDCFCVPIQDINNNWVISENVAELIKNDWISKCEQIEFVPKVIDKL